MWNNILLGCLLIILTSFIHTAITRIVLNIVNKEDYYDLPWKRIIHVDLVILIIMLSTLAESALWAICYIQIGSFEKLEESIYFSLVTYSTLGYGDIILNESHRLLGAFEAANGVIMLGWSTAIVVAVIQRVYTKRKK
jgi:hypothetical protein